MKISRLQITIEPWRINDSVTEMRVEADVDGIRHSVAMPFTDDDFESRFDYMMEQSRREILKLVKA